LRTKLKGEKEVIKDIVKDEHILCKKSEPFVLGQDDYIIQDMLDTANFHKDDCCGLAAVQIGYLKRVIIVDIDGRFAPFINPVIIAKSPKTYKATEGCLSVEGYHDVKRHETVMVAYADKRGKPHRCMYFGRTAQIIQHEVDHLNGILI
jgi:peptide deformylase